MAADEGKFGRIGEVRSCWCPKGIRPTVPKQQVRQYVYAAVAPALGQMTCLILLCQYQDDEFILHQVSVELADYFIVMQVDKASWHRSKYLKIPENIRLIHQPSQPSIDACRTYLGRD